MTDETDTISENLVGDGIRVNGVAPRPGQPNDVAPAFLFLACEDSRYMSGQVLHPNGGTIVGS